MKRVADKASSLAKQLVNFQAALDDLIPLYRTNIVECLDLKVEKCGGLKLKLERTPPFLAQKFEHVSNLAANSARAFRDEGGAPSIVEFRELVRSLANAFERATGRPAKVTENPGMVRRKYGGDFLKLVEIMLPLTREIAQQFKWLSLPQSTSARGKYVKKLTRAGKSSPQSSWLISDRGAEERPVKTIKPISDPTHWRDRAAELRALADIMKDPEKIAIMNRSADYFDKIAERAELSGEGISFNPQ